MTSDAMLNSVGRADCAPCLFKWHWLNALPAATNIVCVRAEQQQRREIDRVRHRHRRAARGQRQLTLSAADVDDSSSRTTKQQRLIEPRLRQADREQRRPERR